MDARDRAVPAVRGGHLQDGERIGRFVVLRDVDGRVHAVATGSVAAVCETDDGTLLMLPGGRRVHVLQADGDGAGVVGRESVGEQQRCLP